LGENLKFTRAKSKKAYENMKTGFREAAEKPLHHGRPINSSKIVDEFSYNY
jgi:hypothetical protein